MDVWTIGWMNGWMDGRTHRFSNPELLSARNFNSLQRNFSDVVKKKIDFLHKESFSKTTLDI